MSRLEVELTSQRDDSTWTWRAAGAKKPKGDLDGTLLPSGVKVGDVLRVEADVTVDGISITSVLPPQRERREPERLEIIGPPRNEPGVTKTLLPKKERTTERGNRGDRYGDRGRGAAGEPGRNDRAGQRSRTRSALRPGARQPDERRGRERRDPDDRGRRSERPSDSRPRGKRLKAGRSHRGSALTSLPEEQRQLAEQVLRGGVPGVRQTIERLNDSARTQGRPPIDPEKLVVLAERLLPQLREAEWQDRADAALAQIDTVELGDLRSVINAADTWARGEGARALANELREALPKRVEKEHNDWLDEISSTLADGRLVRALKLSSRPPKAGAPLPPDLAEQLSDASVRGLTAETSSDRYAAVVDALSLSPVRNQVRPLGRPERVGEQLVATIQRTAKQLPQVAELFDVDAHAASPRRKPSARSETKAAPVPPPPPLP